MTEPVRSTSVATAAAVRDEPVRLRAIYTRYPHWGAHSGLKQLLSHLDPRRCAVEPYAVSDSDEDLRLPIAALRDAVRRRIRRRGMSWYKLSDLAAELRALPGCLMRKTDIVHFLDGEHSAQFLPRWLRAWPRARARVIATFHQPPDMLERLVCRDVVTAIDHVTIVSPMQRPYFSGLLPAEQVQVIPHGVDTAFFTPARRPREDATFGTITVGHWLRDWAAIRAVAERLAREPALVFHVVTDRPTGLENMPNVVMHRNVDDATLLSLYQAADCLFLPLVNATANNSLLEGLACGLPVISTSLPSVHAYVPGPEAILVDGNAPDGLAGAVLHLRRHPDVRAGMASRARARAEELAWPRVAAEYEELYQRLSDDAQSRRRRRAIR